MIFFCDTASDAGSCRRLIAILGSTGENLRVLKTGRRELEKVSVFLFYPVHILHHQLLLLVLQHNPVELHKLDNLFVAFLILLYTSENIDEAEGKKDKKELEWRHEELIEDLLCSWWTLKRTPSGLVYCGIHTIREPGQKML